jgi:transcription elongation factor Elf1
MTNWKPFDNKCPFCKSSNLEYGTMEPVDEQIRQDVNCKECGQDFKIWTETKWEVNTKMKL